MIKTIIIQYLVALLLILSVSGSAFYLMVEKQLQKNASYVYPTAKFNQPVNVDFKVRKIVDFCPSLECYNMKLLIGELADGEKSLEYAIYTQGNFTKGEVYSFSNLYLNSENSVELLSEDLLKKLNKVGKNEFINSQRFSVIHNVKYELIFALMVSLLMIVGINVFVRERKSLKK